MRGIVRVGGKAKSRKMEASTKAFLVCVASRCQVYDGVTQKTIDYNREDGFLRPHVPSVSAPIDAPGLIPVPPPPPPPLPVLAVPCCARCTMR